MSTAILGAEFRRTVRLARSYWLEYVSDLLLYTLGFLLLITVFKAASASYGPQGYLSTLIGYTTWKICASILVDIARIATEEAHTGTLEQLFLSNLRTRVGFSDTQPGNPGQPRCPRTGSGIHPGCDPRHSPACHIIGGHHIRTYHRRSVWPWLCPGWAGIGL